MEEVENNVLNKKKKTLRDNPSAIVRMII